MLYRKITKKFDFSKEICDPFGPGNITLCPMCDKACRYQRLVDSCKFARLTYLFDNPATVFFAIFMSLWGNYNFQFHYIVFVNITFQQLYFWSYGGENNA